MTGRARGGKGGGPSPQAEPPDSGPASGEKRPPRRGGRGMRYEPPGEPEAEAVEAHAEFVTRHFGGGAEATPDLLDRAMEVWQRMPGAVVRGPAQIRPNRPNRPSAVTGDEDTTS